jgi:hypothetical protein
VKFTHVSAATDGHENNRETIAGGDLYSVRPGVIKGGHVIDSVVIQSEEDSEGSTVVDLG